MTTGFALSEKMMPCVRKAIANIPSGVFFDIETASVEKDTQQATDLVLRLSGGDVAVRTRNFKYIYEKYGQIDNEPLAFDWSIRFRAQGGGRTEIDKLREGFGRWYFMSIANETETALHDWALIDLDYCRSIDLFDDWYWQIHPNGDNSMGGYLSLRTAESLGVIIAQKYDMQVAI